MLPKGCMQAPEWQSESKSGTAAQVHRQTKMLKGSRRASVERGQTRESYVQRMTVSHMGGWQLQPGDVHR